MTTARRLRFIVQFLITLGFVVAWAIGASWEATQVWQSPAGLPAEEVSPAPVATTSADVPRVRGVATASARVDWEQTTVQRVVDGDTIVVDGGRKVRYIGIDTPETVDPRQSPQCFGKQAGAFNAQLVGGQTVWLETDVSQTDRYGRLLRYVYVADKTDVDGDGALRMVNAVLVSEGYARAASYPPDVKNQQLFSTLEAAARAEQRGLWADGVCGEK